MSKKKIRKPKKKGTTKTGIAMTDWFVYDPVTEKDVNISQLIREFDQLTDYDSLYLIYRTYNDAKSPLFDLSKANDVMDKLVSLGEPYACANKGVKLFEEGKRKEAFPYLLKGKKTGEPIVLYELGLYYNDQKKIGLAIECFEALAHRHDGDGSAAYNTYLLYCREGPHQDLKKAQKYFEMAYKDGFDEAQHSAWENLVHEPIDHYNEKLGFQALATDIRNEKEDALFELEYTYIVSLMSDHKFFLFLSKFPKKNAHIIHYLADCYMFGIGTRPQLQMALKYYRLLKDNSMVKTMLTKVDLFDPYESLLEASKTNKACCYYAGMMAMHGTYGKPDLKLAQSLFENGMSPRYMLNQYALGHLYLVDLEIRDITKAIALLKEYKENSNSQYDLMRLRDLYTIYYEGIGVHEDVDVAESYATSIKEYQI